ncbi:hypothetical protein JCM11641_005808 [Rhodosporidiobolus odoratus]
MPAKHRRYKPKKAEEPTSFGPERPPPPEQPAQPAEFTPSPNQPQENPAPSTTQVELDAGWGRKRYFPDQWRGTRDVRIHDIRVDYKSVLHYFQADIVELRHEYGAQPLRGYDPEKDDNEDESDDEDDNEDESDDEDDPLQDIMMGELAEKGEEEYQPTLTLAPIVMTSFLKFQLARNVFPSHEAKIKECPEIGEVAKQQLLPNRHLFRQLVNHSTLSRTLAAVFPDSHSSLALPLCDSPSNQGQLLREVVAAVEADSEQVVVDAARVAMKQGTAGAQARRHGGKGKTPLKHSLGNTSEDLADGVRGASGEAVDGDLALLDRLKKQKELDRLRSRMSPLSTAEEAAKSFVLQTEQLQLVKDGAEGQWVVVQRERTARSLLSWEFVFEQPGEGGSGARAAPSTKTAQGDGIEKVEPAAKQERLLVKLKLGAHEYSFLLTTKQKRQTDTTFEAIKQSTLLPFLAFKRTTFRPHSI